MEHTIENSKNTLAALLTKVQDQAARSADFLAPTTDLQIKTDDEGESTVIIEAAGGEPTRHLKANDVCAGQIAAKAGIDSKTAKRFQAEYPDVFDHAIRRIWDQEPKRQMVRTFLDEDERDGTARAFVSDKFKTFDNHHLLAAALPQLMESDAQWEIVDGEVTEKRLYVRMKSNAIVADRSENTAVNLHSGMGKDAFGNRIYNATGADASLPATRHIDGANRAVGDVMALAIGLGNSEVGMGSVQVYQAFYTLACLNMLQTENRSRTAHLTSARGQDDIVKMLTDEAIEADNNALKLKLRDVIAGYASRESFEEVLEKMRMAASERIHGPLPEAVANLGKVLKLTKKGTENVLDGLMDTLQQPGYAGQPASKATLVNAVTAVAHRVGPDEVDDWQKLGGKVLDLPAKDWRIVAEAA